MSQEVECKIMGMTVKEFLNLTALKNLRFEIDLKMIVTNTYWELPSGELIRCGRCRVGNGFEDFYNLTIKGLEEGDGSDISSRMEIVLHIREGVDPEDINKFFCLIGAKKKYIVKKERTILYEKNSWLENGRDVLIYHDKLIDGGLDSPEWVEIESGSGNKTDIKDIILELGINLDRVSNKSTLDMLDIAGE